MLGIVSARGAGLNAGSVGLLMAQRWSAASKHTLLIDADTTGRALARRLGSAMQTEYSPAERGLPSLIAAHEPLTLKTMADHCYSLGAGGSRWVLFAPSHPDGAKYAARWLSERAGELMEIDQQRTIIIACSLDDDEEDLLPLLKTMPRLVLLAPARTREDAETLQLSCDRSGLLDDSHGGTAQQRASVVIVGPTALEDDEIEAIAKLPLAGQLPEIDDKKLLQMQRGRRGRRGRVFTREFDQVFEFCLSMSEYDIHPAARSTPSPLPDDAVGEGDATGAVPRGQGRLLPSDIDEGA